MSFYQYKHNKDTDPLNKDKNNIVFMQLETDNYTDTYKCNI